MNGPESSGEQEHKDITRTTEHFSDAVINRGPMEPMSDQVNELTGSETELFLLNSQDVIKAIRNMIDHEVEALEKFEQPGPLAPLSEHQKFVYKTAETYGGVNALHRLQTILEKLQKDLSTTDNETVRDQPSKIEE